MRLTSGVQGAEGLLAAGGRNDNHRIRPPDPRRPVRRRASRSLTLGPGQGTPFA